MLLIYPGAVLKPLIATALLLSSGWAIAAEPPDGCALCAKAGVWVWTWIMGAHRARDTGIRPAGGTRLPREGISHVRIRVADEPTEARLIHHA